MVGRIIVAAALAFLLGAPAAQASVVKSALGLTLAQSGDDDAAGSIDEAPQPMPRGKRHKSIFDEPPPSSDDAPPPRKKKHKKKALVVNPDDIIDADAPPPKKKKSKAPPPEDDVTIDADAPPPKKTKSAPPPSDDSSWDPDAPVSKKKPSDDLDAPPKKAKPADEAGSSVDDAAPPKKAKRTSDDDEDAAPKKKKPASDDDEDAAPKKKKQASDDDEDAPKKKKKSSDDDDDAPKKKKKSSDDDDSDSGKKQEEESSSDEVVVHAGWGAVAGHAPNGQLVLAELGLPGVRALYMVSKSDTFAYGGGGGIDFPPLSFSGHSPRGFNSLRFIGRLDYYVPTDVVQLYVRFEPQWIAAIGDASIGGIFYLPVEGGAGFDVKSAHLAVSAGFGAQFTGSSLLFPFTDFVFSSPFVGLSGELPLSDNLALTARLRLQTYAWDRDSADHAPTFVGLGFVMLGAAYRF